MYFPTMNSWQDLEQFKTNQKEQKYSNKTKKLLFALYICKGIIILTYKKNLFTYHIKNP